MAMNLDTIDDDDDDPDDDDPGDFGNDDDEETENGEDDDPKEDVESYARVDVIPDGAHGDLPRSGHEVTRT